MYEVGLLVGIQVVVPSVPGNGIYEAFIYFGHLKYIQPSPIFGSTSDQ